MKTTLDLEVEKAARSIHLWLQSRRFGHDQNLVRAHILKYLHEIQGLL